MITLRHTLIGMFLVSSETVDVYDVISVIIYINENNCFYLYRY